ncbi:MAG: hypothetical protein U9Q07_02990 [Planctomycetota bacterium]|nr:hypothetical protein [Planctomycetota bacterium]
MIRIERIVDRLIDCAIRLYYRQWETWELLALALAALFLFIMVIRSRIRAAANAKHLQERTPKSQWRNFREL